MFTIEEQLNILKFYVPNFSKRTFTALSASGIVWVDHEANEAFLITSSGFVSKLR